MIKAVIFDMFETLVTLFEGKPYFAEDIAADVGLDSEVLRKEWRSTDDDKSLGKITVEEALEIVFKRLGVYSEENVRLAAGKRAAALENTFNHIPDETFQMLKGLKDRGIKIGLMSNAYSDERDYIKRSPIFDYIDVPLISYEQGIFKPSPEMYKRMIDRLGVDASECLFVGDGGSRELYAARDAGMHPVQCTWFHERAFEPHIPCPILDEFDHADTQMDVLKYLLGWQKMDFEITDIVREVDKNAVFKGLLEYNLSKLEDKNPKELGIYHKVDGIIKAGLIGHTHGNWLEVEYLWVSEELRDGGIGSKLLEAAENEARTRGCKYCFLNTFSFQAPDFYAKHSYKQVFELENYPISGKRHYYTKEL